MEVGYSPTFLRQLKSLPSELQAEAIEKIELFQRQLNHPQLKTHKLKGRLNGRYSFSVNYRTRIVFTFSNTKKPRVAYLLAIGDHAVYS
ncbi:type II toxin-antitoxin system mRNA interferase toxin, RelE/StbE family [Patescibacteria group bacterium]|nr:type II toxin-antitoxin system mRNA interferase toxin, RelE/StbE family [Patescibacteria group bacterium]MBP9710079.1 type II toxin-antitoxin system mRNA interferase toxin, RelE/StbE family [Patescibacteria group bacterium]